MLTKKHNKEDELLNRAKVYLRDIDTECKFYELTESERKQILADTIKAYRKAIAELHSLVFGTKSVNELAEEYILNVML
jgi:hypothetical protein